MMSKDNLFGADHRQHILTSVVAACNQLLFIKY